MRAPGRLRLAAARGAFKGAPRCPKISNRNPGRMPLVALGVAPQIEWSRNPYPIRDGAFTTRRTHFSYTRVLDLCSKKHIFLEHFQRASS